MHLNLLFKRLLLFEVKKHNVLEASRGEKMQSK